MERRAGGRKVETAINISLQNYMIYGHKVVLNGFVTAKGSHWGGNKYITIGRTPSNPHRVCQRWMMKCQMWALKYFVYLGFIPQLTKIIKTVVKIRNSGNKNGTRLLKRQEKKNDTGSWGEPIPNSHGGGQKGKRTALFSLSERKASQSRGEVVDVFNVPKEVSLTCDILKRLQGFWRW